MRRPLLVSLGCHVAGAILAIVGVWLGPRALPPETVVTVEIVQAGPPRVDARAVAPPAEAAPLPKREATAIRPAPVTETATPPVPRPEPPRQEPPRAEPPKPEPARAEPPPRPAERAEPPRPTATAQAKPEPAPTPAARPALAKPEPAKPEPTRTAAADPRQAPPKPAADPARAEPKPVVKAPDPAPRQVAARDAPVEPAKPAAPPKPPAERKPEPAKAEDSLDALLKSVENQARRVAANEPRSGRGSAQTAAGAAVDPNALAASIRDQVTRCWSIPAGARDVAQMRAELDITFGPDGSVQRVAPLDQGRMAQDGIYRVFAESAARAVQACSPLKLPSESYQAWRRIIFNFDPSALG